MFRQISTYSTSTTVVKLRLNSWVLNRLKAQSSQRCFSSSQKTTVQDADDIDIFDWNLEDIDIDIMRTQAPLQTQTIQSSSMPSTPISLHMTSLEPKNSLKLNYPLKSQASYSRGSLKSSHDTIFQLSSGLGPFSTGVGIAIIRISGPQATQALLSISNLKSIPKPRYATLCSIYDISSSTSTSASTSAPTSLNEELPLIDHNALCLYFPGPKSFTGEDVVEIHTHGNPVIVSATLHSLTQVQGLRIAEAGEFTRRAFLHNKLDLTQVEGLGDMLAAKTERQHRQALSQLRGSNSVLYNKWRRNIVECLAYVESIIDFGEDEADIAEEELLSNVYPRVEMLVKRLQYHLADGRRGETVRNGIKMSILGAPNAGKSSLLNTLTCRDIAIVSSIPGTTRDVVETTLDIAGWPIIVADTAGLRETSDLIEREGVKRAQLKALQDDIRIVLFDGDIITNVITNTMTVLTTEYNIQINHDNPIESLTQLTPFAYDIFITEFTKQMKAHFDQLSMDLVHKDTIVVVSKADKLPLSSTFTSQKLKTAKTVDPIFHSEFTIVKEELYNERHQAMQQELTELEQLLGDKTKAQEAYQTMSRGYLDNFEEDTKDGEIIQGSLTSVPWEDFIITSLKGVFPITTHICLLSSKMEYKLDTLFSSIDTIARNKFDKSENNTSTIAQSNIPDEETNIVIMNQRHRVQLEKTLQYLNLFLGADLNTNTNTNVDAGNNNTNNNMENTQRGSKYSHFRALEQNIHPASRASTLTFVKHTTDNLNFDLVLAAEHLRLAAHCMGEILGAVDTEELLDVIFNDFCIGK